MNPINSVLTKQNGDYYQNMQVHEIIYVSKQKCTVVVKRKSIFCKNYPAFIYYSSSKDVKHSCMTLLE